MILLTSQNSGFCVIFPLGYKIAVTGLPCGEMTFFLMTDETRYKIDEYYLLISTLLKKLF